MIPESAGATPYGIFLLAKAFHEAALHLIAAPSLRFSQGPAPEGPIRLLCYHACELYLKAYLRLHQWDADELRALNHDLARMLAEALSAGLKVAPQTVAQIRKAAEKNDYVRARYLVVKQKPEISPQSLALLTADIRDSVGAACDPTRRSTPEA